MICDVHRPDGTPFDSDPRYVLKRVLEDARSDGLNLMYSDRGTDTYQTAQFLQILQ